MSHSINFKDLTGQQIKNWKVLKYLFTKNKQPFWECRCVCNKIKIVGSNSLRNGSKSCGCKHNRKWRLGKYKELRYTVIRNIMARYNCEAKNRNLDFCLDFNQFSFLVRRPCFYCGIKKSSYQKSATGRNVWYNGIDRVDNTKGYSINNCVTCCKSCNSKKKSITPDMIKKAYEFLFK